MKKIALTAMALLMLWGCGGTSIRDTVVTPENKEQVMEQAMASDKLTQWEKQLLVGAQVQEEFPAMIGGGGGGQASILYGKTVEQIIQEAQAREDRKNARD